MILLGLGARLAGVRACNVESTRVAVILILVAFDGMLCITAVVAVAIAVVVVAVVVAPVLLAVELGRLQGLLLHGGCTIWHHWHYRWLLLSGGRELDLLGGDSLLHFPHVRLHLCERRLQLVGHYDGTICRLAGCHRCECGGDVGQPPLHFSIGGISCCHHAVSVGGGLVLNLFPITLGLFEVGTKD